MSTLVLYQPATQPWGTPNMSPFCAKLETYLRMTDVPYEARPANFPRAPKGKIPYVEIDGALMGDSQLIIDKLEARSKEPLDGWLSPEQKAIAHSVRRMIEEGSYFVGLHLRWVRDDGYSFVAPEFRRFLPRFLGFALFFIRRAQRKKLRAQGTGRHTEAEIQAIGAADIDALAVILGDKPYLFGDRPCTCDATVYAFLEAFMGFPLESDLKKKVRVHENLTSYQARIRERWWKDLPKAS